MQQAGLYHYVIEGRDVDHTGYASFVSICNYLLQAAGEDADRNGFGVRDLNCGNCSWVLSRMAVETYGRPGQSARLTVRTWVNEVNRMMTTRNMSVTTDDGQTVAAAITQWAIIDLDSRHPLDIRSHLDPEGKVTDEPSPITRPARLGSFGAERLSSHCVVYSDIDFNRHVNSMKYVEWMLDMVPIEMLESGPLCRFDINFLHEALYGQQLSIGYAHGREGLFEIADAEGRALCRAAFRW